MSNDATKWAWKQKCPPMEKLILVLLADHLNGKTAQLNPGTKKLCEESGLTRQGVFNQIERLETRGLLFVEHCKGKVNRYRLPVNHVDQSTTLTSQPDGLPLVNRVDHYQSTPLTTLVNGVDPNRKEPEEEQEEEPEAPAFRLDAQKPKARKDRGTLEEFRAFAVEIGLPASDGEARFYGLESNGWKAGKNPVKDWKASMRTWKINGFHPSQKNGGMGSEPAPKSEYYPPKQQETIGEMVMRRDREYEAKLEAEKSYFDDDDR